MTDGQKKLADLLWNTKIHAKVRRRKQLPDGSFQFYLVYRDTRPIDFREDRGEFVFKHHEKNPEAPLSPMYINLRNLPQNLVDEIAKNLASIKIEEKIDFCTGIPKAAIPFAKKYSEITNISYIEIYDKEDGEAKRVVTQTKNAPKGRGKNLLIIDDLITKGLSKLEAFKIAEDLGYKIIALLVLFDREEGGIQMLEKQGYKVLAVMQLKPTLEYFLETRKITRQQFEDTMNYLASS